MKKVLFLLLLSLIAAVSFAAQVAAQPAPVKQSGDPEDEVVNVKAVRLSYDRENSMMIAQGNVEMSHGGRTLNTDYLKINLATKDAYAKGHVTLNQGGDLLVCDDLKMNLDDRRGQVQNARVFIKKQNFHLAGKEFKSLGQNNYQISNGEITTCDGDKPAWKIDAKKIDVTLEGYAKIQGGTFRVKNVPVMYFPYFLLPVKTERQSGFLFPEFGTSSRKGFEFNNSFFWAQAPNRDATFYLDTATRKGPGEGLEYRLVTGSNSWAKFYGYHAYELNDYFDDAYSNPEDRNQNRGMTHVEGQHYFSPDLYIKGFGTYISDREFYNDYASKAKRTEMAWDRGGKLRALERDESFLFATKNWDFHSLLVNVNFSKDLIQSNPETLQRLPQVAFASLKQPLWKTPLFYQLNSSYDYFWREEGLKGNRIDVYPRLSWPMNKGGWITFVPEVGVRGISYFGLSDNDDYNKSQVFPDMHAELYLTFLRICQVNKQQVEKVKHTIEPRLEYEYVPDFQQDDFPQFDYSDTFNTVHILSYSVTNRFSGLVTGDDGEQYDREFGYLKIGQAYNLRKPVDIFYGDQQQDRDRLSDLFAELRVDIISALYFKTKAGYNPNDKNLSYYNALLAWQNMSGEYLDLSYRYERNRLEEWDTKGRLKIFEPVYCFFDSTYNLLESEKLDNSFGLDYSAQCWGTKFWYTSESKSGGQKSSSGVRLTFYLKGMGIAEDKTPKEMQRYQ